MVTFLPLALLMLQAPQTDSRNWNVYANAKYGYEIRYPHEFEALPTGREGQRDGASIRIKLKEYEAPAPVLDIYVGEASNARRSLPTDGAAGMDVLAVDVTVGNLRARQTTYRWKSNRDIALIEIRNPDFVFVFQPGAGISDFQTTVWYEVIQTFRLLKK